ncbi:hypothetical protein G9A89_007217 [Geosiphon pyriformis]|nr:hypothetical protein G9A89_007217 [Geosiphon pyriformis]
MRSTLWQQNSIAAHTLLNTLKGQNGLGNGTINHAWLVEKLFWTKECGMTFLGKEHPEPVINLLDPERFHEYYQELAPTREEQKQHLEEINTRLCNHCFILCDFQYCNECNLIYNLPPHMIYTIPEEDKPISSCTLELESVFNSDLNSDNDDNKNNSSSSTQHSNKNNNDLNFDSNPETFIALPDLTKKQRLKWFSDNNENIMPECAHDTDAKFDLRYSEKNAIKLEPHSRIYIDLKIALEIPATTMV